MDEQWRPIPGHRGYEASTEGHIRSVDRRLRNGRRLGGVVLGHHRDKDGYPRVKIRGRMYGVHVLVQLAFAGPPEVRHLDGDRSNCKPENLAYGSRVENEQDKRKGKDGKERDTGERPYPAGTPGTGDQP